MTITWYESDDPSERETTNKVITFIGKFESEKDFDDEDMIKKDLAATLRLLYTKWGKACSTVEKHNETINGIQNVKENLVSTTTDIEEEVTLLKSKLENMKKFVRMLKNGIDMLEEILEIEEKCWTKIYSYP